MQRNNGNLLQTYRVPLGFLCGMAGLVLARPGYRSLLIGGTVASVGVLIRAWASGHIRKNERLATSGPYAYTRNPLYFGSFIIGIGFLITAGLNLLWACFFALFLCVYVPVMKVEAEAMTRAFGDQYRTYAAKVPLFFPRLTPYRNGAASVNTFDSGLYLRYREYRALLGFLLIWSILFAKTFLRST